VKINDAPAGAALILLGATILWHIQGFPAMPGQKFGPAWFPGLIAAGLAICGAMLVLSGAKRRGPWLALPEWTGRARPLAGVAAILAGLIAYIFLVDRLGFHLTGIALLALWIRVLGGGWRITFAVAIGATVIIHLSFYKLLRIPLPWGIFERWAF